MLRRVLIGLFPLLTCLGACKPRHFNSKGNQAASSSTKPPSSQGACEGAASTSAWCADFTKRDAALKSYLKTRNEDFASFASASLGGGGFPFILLRLAPTLFKSAWDAAGGANHLSMVGFADDPFNPAAQLPLGLGMSAQKLPLSKNFAPDLPMHVVTLSCGGCHIGRVKGPDGKSMPLVGAGNSHFDGSTLFGLFKAIVEHPNFTAEKIAAEVKKMPAGWFFGGKRERDKFAETVERQFFTALAPQTVELIKKGVLGTTDRQDAFLAKGSYKRSGALGYFERTPGRADAVGLSMLLYLKEGEENLMPPTPTISKLMSVWAQKDRGISHWAGDMPPGINPVVAAEVAVIGEVPNLNKDNLVRSTRFIHDLPSPPYPFAVDDNKARAGKALFDKACASCHKIKETKLYPASETGTDPARLNATSEKTYAGFNKALHEGCPQNVNEPLVKCTDPKTPILRPRDLPQGFVATPLDGIWARSPYLHNGSVPTLRQLLVPSSRAPEFMVGGMEFNTVEVGFEWKIDGGIDWKKDYPEAVVYKTGVAAQMNTGHDSKEYLGGIDWKNSPDELDALLEYMKTL